MRSQAVILSLLLMLSVSVACKRVPSYVIAPDDMAQLMADIHTAEAVVDMERNKYSTDSARLSLRQAIFQKYGVTNEQFDTSLVWYGHNIDKYIEVYDNTIKELERREKALGNAIVQQNVSISGDSVDVWAGSRYAVLSERMPADVLSFDLDSDENWESGDVYTWRVKVVDEGIRSLKWNILANYSDNTCDWLSSTSTGMGWNEMVFVSDSTKTLTGLRGSIEAILPSADYDETASSRHDYWIDSISLVRKRVTPEFYVQRSRLRSYRNY